MLRVTRSDEPEGACFKLEGKLSGSWVDVVEQSWKHMSSECTGARCVVDLSAVTYVDPRGMALLGEMYRSGIGLRASGCLGKGIVEQIETQSEAPLRAAP
jgi:ABC-type transporter Mla MlaB component